MNPYSQDLFDILNNPIVVGDIVRCSEDHPNFRCCTGKVMHYVPNLCRSMFIIKWRDESVTKENRNDLVVVKQKESYD